MARVKSFSGKHGLSSLQERGLLWFIPLAVLMLLLFFFFSAFAIFLGLCCLALFLLVKGLFLFSFFWRLPVEEVLVGISQKTTSSQCFLSRFSPFLSSLNNLRTLRFLTVF